MVVIANTRDELKKALISKQEEILVIDVELAENIGKFIERLNFKTEREFKNRVTITSVSLIIGTNLLINFIAFGFLIVGVKILIVPEIIMFIAFLIALSIKLNNLLKNNYAIVNHDESGLRLKYKLS